MMPGNGYLTRPALVKFLRLGYTLRELTIMPNICVVTGKKTVVGSSKSHSNVKTKRSVYPNVTKRRLKNPATGRMLTVCISARGLRTLKKWDREGKAYDLAKLAAV
jgi:large subunit ribosomal protein L28